MFKINKMKASRNIFFNFIIYICVSIISLIFFLPFFSDNIIYFLSFYFASTVCFLIFERNLYVGIYLIIFCKITLFRQTYYRDNYESSIIQNLGSLTKKEKIQIDNMLTIIKKITWFDFVFKQDHFDYIYKYYSCGVTRNDVNMIVKDVCKYLKLDPKFIYIETYKPNYYFKNPAGSFIPVGNIGGEIRICISKSLDIYALLSIIIHECIHYFMHVHSINEELSKYSDEIETYTDLFSVYLGLGKYMILGYQTMIDLDEKYFSGLEKHTLGYLRIEELVYAQNKLLV